MKFLLFILVIIDNLNVLLANNDNCRVNDLNALMVRLRQLPTEFNDLKIQHDATQAEIKVLKEANGKQETELEKLRQEINNKSTEIKLINEENRKQETELEELRQEINNKSTEIKLIKDATQAEIKVLKEANGKQETELEELRQDVNNKSLEIAAISKDIEMIKGIDDCMSSPCQNGATCNDGVNSYTCMCSPGYTGTYCDTDIDECNSDPCQNGTCTDGVDSYTCTCVAGYTGTNCETDIDECMSSPCQIGATCNDGVNNYTCTCRSGYTGTYCDIDIDECNPNPCPNGAICTDGLDSYTCKCVTGNNCERSFTKYCPTNWYLFQENCYYRSTKALRWLEAVEDCIALGGHLVEITSEQENDFIQSIIGPTRYRFWIGLNDKVTEGVFVWVSSGNNASGVYTKWAPGEQNDSDEDCVVMDYFTGIWYSNPCSYDRHYICEKESMFG